MIFILKSLHWAILQQGQSCQATTSFGPLFCVRGFNVWGGGFKAHFKVAFVAALKQHWQQGRQGHEHGYIFKKKVWFLLLLWSLPVSCLTLDMNAIGIRWQTLS